MFANCKVATMTLQETDNGIEIIHCREEVEHPIAATAPSLSSIQSPTSSPSPPSAISTTSISQPILKNTSTSWTPTSTQHSNESSFSRSELFDLEYSDEEASFVSTDDNDADIDTTNNNESNSNTITLQDIDSSYPSVRTLELVIDEIPSMQTSMKNKVGNVIPSSTHLCKPTRTGRSNDVMACPCCRSYVDCPHKKKSYRIHGKENNVHDSKSLPSFVDGLWLGYQQKTESLSDENETKMIEYEIMKIVLEGWLYKRGTGNDIFGSTSWKARWCSLIVSREWNHQLVVVCCTPWLHLFLKSQLNHKLCCII